MLCIFIVITVTQLKTFAQTHPAIYVQVKRTKAGGRTEAGKGRSLEKYERNSGEGEFCFVLFFY